MGEPTDTTPMLMNLNTVYFNSGVQQPSLISIPLATRSSSKPATLKRRSPASILFRIADSESRLRLA